MTKDPKDAGVVTLYKNHKNTIGFWQGWVENDTLIMEYASGIHHSIQRVTEKVLDGKQGRSIHEQALFRLKSRMNSKLDAGYVLSYEDAKEPPTDATGKIKPMLAQKFTDYKKKIQDDDAFIQLKYNGHRCLITKQDGQIFAYSRNGKDMPGIPHILAEIDIPDGTIIDGEIYRHGMRLQEIASACKKLQPVSKMLQYVAYDIVLPYSFSERLDELKQQNLGSFTRIAPTKRLNEIADLNDSMRKALKAGYEGLMMRIDGTIYEAGRRSSSLLKIKQFDDAEFYVVDVTPSKDGWGILHCLLPNNSTFKVSAPGTMYEKEFVLKNKDQFIGQLVTIEYSEYTADGVPFHPVAIAFRNPKDE